MESTKKKISSAGLQAIILKSCKSTNGRKAGLKRLETIKIQQEKGISSQNVELSDQISTTIQSRISMAADLGELSRISTKNPVRGKHLR